MKPMREDQEGTSICPICQGVGLPEQIEQLQVEVGQLRAAIEHFLRMTSADNQFTQALAKALEAPQCLVKTNLASAQVHEKETSEEKTNTSEKTIPPSTIPACLDVIPFPYDRTRKEETPRIPLIATSTTTFTR